MTRSDGSCRGAMACSLSSFVAILRLRLRSRVCDSSTKAPQLMPQSSAFVDRCIAQVLSCDNTLATRARCNNLELQRTEVVCGGHNSHTSRGATDLRTLSMRSA